jgi:hypothetical protein
MSNDNTPIYKSIEDAKDALDRGETVRIAWEPFTMSVDLARLARQFQDKQALLRNGKNPMNNQPEPEHIQRDKRIKRQLDMIKTHQSLCPTCGRSIKWREQIGFASYAQPCGHKLGTS